MIKLSVGRSFLMMGLMLIGNACVQAQVTTGTPPFGSFGGGPDIINLANLNSHITVPIVNKAGRGTAFTYNLSYDTSIWYPVTTSGVTTWIPVTNLGWHVETEPTTGYVRFSAITSTCAPPSHGEFISASNWVYHDMFGVPHPFAGTAVVTDCGGSPKPLTGVVSTDGSGYTLTTGPTLSVTSRTGKVFSPPINAPAGVGSFADANGNEISVSSTGVFTDTLGTTALTVAGSATASSPVTFTYTPPSGTNVAYTMNYTSYTVATNFGVSGITEYGATALPLVSSIVLPDGTQYTFTYEATPSTPSSGACTPLSGTYAANCITGRLASITLPTGGAISYVYLGGNNGILSDGTAASLKRTTPDGSWTYAHSESGTEWTTTVTDPQANQTVLNFQGIYQTESQVYQGSAGGTLLKTVSTCYNGNTTTSTCDSTAITLPITQQSVFTQWPGGLQSRFDSLYNSYGLITETDEYGYGSGAPGSILRKTLTSYATLTNGIVANPSSITTTDGTGAVKSQTSYCYDEGTPSGTAACAATGAPTPTSGTPQSIAISGSRGNITTIASLIQGSTTLGTKFTYYDTGNLRTATGANLAVTTYNYGAGSCGNSFPTSVNEPLGLSISIAWNCTGGVETSVTDENGQTTSATFNDPYFWRLHTETDAGMNTSTWSYNSANSAEVSLPFNGVSSTSDVLITLDKLGRNHLSQVKQGPNATLYDTQETDYNPSGFASKSTLRFPIAAGTENLSAAGVTTIYDALGRVATRSDSGGGTTMYSYSQNDVLETIGPHPTGENAKSKQYEYDALGRLTSVCEITGASGTWSGGPCGQTTAATGYLTKYTYDLNNKLTSVTQNAQSSTIQSRTYAYDDLGRLTSEQNPETNAIPITYGYDSDATCGSSSGDLVKKIDAMSNVICYTYDGLHRVTSVTYPSGNYASVTPSKYFVYDSATVNSVAMANGKSRLVEAYTCELSCPTPTTDLGFSYSARGEIAAVYEKTPNSISYYVMSATYWANGALHTLGGLPTLPTLTYTPDGEGRPAIVTASAGQNPVVSTTYNSASKPLSMTLGSSDSDSFTYDSADRMTQFQTTINSQSFTGTVGWNALGTPATLSIVDPFNTADNQNCTFNHDDLVRTSAVNCGTIWGQNFSYDPFGNVDKSVVSGDSGIAFQANYSTSTNQISSVAGFTPIYDANGNLKSDSAHTYTWNSDARPVTIDSTNLTYDAFNRIVEQSVGGVSTQTVYDPMGEKFALMNAQTLQKAFAPLPDGGIAAYTSSGLTYYRHPDWLGSSRLASTPNRTIYADVAYAPFGESYAPSGATDLSFTGQNQDAIPGLYDFLYREQSPIQGRWISPDPAGRSAVILTDPQSFNRYAYVRNSGLLLVDALGLKQCVTDVIFLGYRNDKPIYQVNYICTGPPSGDPGPVGNGPTNGGGNSKHPDPRCPGKLASAVTSAVIAGVFPPAGSAQLAAVASGQTVTVGFDASLTIGFGTLGISVHAGDALAFDPSGGIALISTTGGGGGFAGSAGDNGGAKGVDAGFTAQTGYLNNVTSVSQLTPTSDTITSTTSIGAEVAGSFSSDLEGDKTVGVGAGAGFSTSSTWDFSKVTILACAP